MYVETHKRLLTEPLSERLLTEPLSTLETHKRLLTDPLSTHMLMNCSFVLLRNYRNQRAE